MEKLTIELERAYMDYLQNNTCKNKKKWYDIINKTKENITYKRGRFVFK